MFKSKKSVTLNKQNRQPNKLPLAFPVILGLSAFILLFGLIDQEVIANEMVKRYLAGHPVSKVTTALFLIGLASLILIARDISFQFRWHRQPALKKKLASNAGAGDRAPSSSTPPSTEQLIENLNEHDQSFQRTYLFHRLMNALNFIKRNGSADGLDEELKYAADLDIDAKHERYSFVRIMIWAIPMLGFLGTVLGISEALGGIDIGEGNNFQAMMGNLRSSLYVAFDTTAIALTFAILLMFMQFIVDRFESSLLTDVDRHAREELSDHWNVTNHSKDSYVRTVEAIGASVLESTQGLVDRQVKLWRSNIDAAESAWVESVRAAQDAVGDNLQQALGKSSQQLSENLCETIQRSDDAVARRWEQWQVTLSENARLLAAHQEQLVDQAKQLVNIVQQLGHASETKGLLSDYLSSLPDTSEFSKATEKLSTAIRILEYRLSDLGADQTDDPENLQESELLDRAA